MDSRTMWLDGIVTAVTGPGQWLLVMQRDIQRGSDGGVLDSTPEHGRPSDVALSALATILNKNKAAAGMGKGPDLARLQALELL